MTFENPTGTVLYTIDQAIKAYRKLALSNLQKAGLELTVDQGLTLLVIHRHPTATQVEMANMIFKDFASMTRMIQLMEKKGLLKRKMNPEDRRRFRLQITPKGEAAVEALEPVIELNRNTALGGFSETEIIQLQSMLERVISNCAIK